jgi:hypothetical protein
MNNALKLALDKSSHYEDGGGRLGDPTGQRMYVYMCIFLMVSHYV